MLLSELLLGQLTGVAPGNPLRSLCCVTMPLALRGDSFHFASFSPTISIVQMYPAYRLRWSFSSGKATTVDTRRGGTRGTVPVTFLYLTDGSVGNIVSRVNRFS